jgi:hypothetical protein
MAELNGALYQTREKITKKQLQSQAEDNPLNN